MGGQVSIFEVVFSLTGLVLGLALVEVLSGLTKVVKARGHLKIGLLIPLLGLFVLGDVTSFWGQAYEVRDLIPSVWPGLGVALVITSIYYVAASLTIPPDLTTQTDYDDHYWRNRRIVLGLVLLCNLMTWAIGFAMGRVWSPTIWTINLICVALVITAAFAKDPAPAPPRSSFSSSIPFWPSRLHRRAAASHRGSCRKRMRSSVRRCWSPCAHAGRDGTWLSCSVAGIESFPRFTTDAAPCSAR